MTARGPARLQNSGTNSHVLHSPLSEATNSPFSSHSNELPLNMLHHHFNRQLEGLLCPAYISHNYSILTDASSESFDEEQEQELAVDQGIYSAVQRRSFVAMCPGESLPVQERFTRENPMAA